MANTPHILIADDDRQIRTSITRFLSDSGFRVSAAEDGVAAFAAVENGRFDLVVLDIKMPGMDGIQTLNEIKKIDKDQHVILCSAYGEFKQDFSSWVSDAYVVKSADMRELKETIKNVLGV